MSRTETGAYSDIDKKEDVKILHSMGYAQELDRRMSRFSNFAISFSKAKRPSMGRDWGEAHAPIWLSFGREAKYASASASLGRTRSLLVQALTRDPGSAELRPHRTTRRVSP